MRDLHRERTLAVISLGLTAALAIGCPEQPQDDPPEETPSVVIDGDHGVMVGDSLPLTAATHDGTDSGYVWSTDDPAVATVDAGGNVQGVAAGETRVIAEGVDTGATGEHPVVVMPPEQVDDPVVLLVGGFVVEVGHTLELVAETLGSEDSGYAWTSSDETLATVTDGVVLGVAPGEVVITAAGLDTGVQGDLAVVVTHEPVDPGAPPFEQEWAGSPHADPTAEAFTHWNDDGVIEADCARCHSTHGFFDYLGEDGSPAGTVEQDAAPGTVVECQACHNPSAIALTTATFPSGVTVAELGPEARCMACHQGRESTVSLEQAIADAAVVDDDTPDADLAFVNIHYAAAGATQHGGLVGGGYEYPQATYDTRFEHDPSARTCVECHDPHTLELQLTRCAGCHPGVLTADDTHAIRMASSWAADYDGDGDVEEGLHGEIDTLRSTLLALIQAYPVDQGQDPICYDEHAYPYFFIDTDGDGSCDGAEAIYPNQYASWSARLLRAAYDYQYASKDPGGFAHNGKYVIQLLSDAVGDLNGAVAAPLELSAMVRDDAGHFDGTALAFRYFDEDGVVPAECASCHGGSAGLRFFLDHGVGTETAPVDGMDCATCHEAVEPQELVAVSSVTYPGGTTIVDGDGIANLCGTCHAGRESGASVDAQLASGAPSFPNVHHAPAAAVRNGADAGVGHEYPGKSYAGPFVHPEAAGCGYCHDAGATAHTLAPDRQLALCQDCHVGVAEVAAIRQDPVPTDWDGDGAADEHLADELHTLTDDLLAELQLVAAAAGAPICYAEHAYPYFFADSDGSGDCAEDEASYPNRYGDWSEALLKAGFNYHLARMEPAAWAHNFDYMAQLLIDSIEDLGGDVGDYARP